MLYENTGNLYFKGGNYSLSVYEKVRAYLDDNGLKQVTVAQKAGISKVTFNAIMNGKRTLYADDLRAICLALNVSPELFIDVKTKCKPAPQVNADTGGEKS